jgi:4-hydroxybenzoate polyprenyltransferase
MVWPLLRASHPEPAVAVTIVGTLLAFSAGRPAATCALVGSTVLASQLCVGWCNDWLDAERDRAVGRSDKPVAAGQVSRPTVGIASIAAGVATVALAVASGWPHGGIAVVGLASALAYNWPLKFSVLSPVPYGISFGCLAAFASGRSPWWLVAAAALLGSGAHFANVLPDLADDARTGVRGLPHRLGATGSVVASAVLLLAATLTLVFGRPGGPSWAGLVILGTAGLAMIICWYATNAGRTRLVFRAVMAVALADVVLLLLSG